MSKNQKLKAAIIGCGTGLLHLKAYNSNENYQLTALCDPDPERIERCVELGPVKGNIEKYTDYRELLKSPDVDVVSVCSPDFFHAEQAVDCLKAGKHVLCEKPMTLDLEEAAAIAAAVKETGRHFMVAHPTRYTPAFILAKKLIARGDIGEIFMAETEYAHNYRYMDRADIPNWRKDARRDPLLGGGCHAVDLLRWAVDDLPDEAFAYGTKKGLADWPIDFDSYFCIYKFRNRVIGKVMCSISVSRPYTMRSVFYGTKGTIICDNRSDHIRLSSVPFYDSTHDETPFITIPVEINNHNVESQVQLLAEVILNGAKNSADVIEGARTVAACTAAIESAHTGKAVKVRNDF